ncbi:MAG: transposase [Deltaproteobacteria bacterium CG12_big_fil_rev_8_21_14_0_65_43_10]|nr:MAG: transposase [Deltaproteobacteria bacterium CG12_big_fil_rev_8_21_14_0_65_43_10]
MTEDMAVFSLAHLPIVKEYAQRMEFVEIIDKALSCGMHVSPGQTTLGLVMNVLCGRSPVYRVEEFFRTRDVGLLIGEEISAEMLNDDAIGRALDRIYEYGTWKIFSDVSLNACRNFKVNRSEIHQDTTSVSVWGNYKEAPDESLRIVYGHSKDKRPDLKQFIISLLCVEGNLPFNAEFQNGNASDKKINGKVIAELPRIMARHGVGKQDFIYVADSALATKTNFSLLGDDIRFITRLPENFGACGEIISKAIASGPWQDVGRLSNRKVNGKEICASYRLREEAINIENRKYRAVVVHSDAHDRRRQKRIDNAVKKDAEVIQNKITVLRQKEFFCLPDAQKAASELKDGGFYRISCSFESRPVYRRGRPGKDGNRPVQGERYRVLATVSENHAAVEKLREEAGCFVLVSNVPLQEKTALEILKTYKEQDGIERNFGFLKDPLIANDIFLKKPHRIEAMGLVFILALLLWRLMERNMREKVKKENIVLQGWNNVRTVRPTAFMMVSKFSPVFVGVMDNRRALFTPLDKFQLAYLDALDVSPSIFTKINTMPGGASRAGYH